MLGHKGILFSELGHLAVNDLLEDLGWLVGILRVILHELELDLLLLGDGLLRDVGRAYNLRIRGCDVHCNLSELLRIGPGFGDDDGSDLVIRVDVALDNISLDLGECENPHVLTDLELVLGILELVCLRDSLFIGR